MGPLHLTVAQTNDFFSEIAVDRYESRSELLVSPEPASVPDRTLPLDKSIGASAFKPVSRTKTAADLQRELEQYRREMSKFLADLSPALGAHRIVLDLDEFDWREETEADRHNFTTTLAGSGEWKHVNIPHYGPPLGRAVTYYRVNFQVTAEMLQKGSLFVAFDGVDYKAHVFVNGAFLGSHEGFFAPFEFDFTPYARLGDNTLLVKVENDHIFMGSLGGVNSDTLDGDKLYGATGLGYDEPQLGWHHCPPAMGICQGVRVEARSRCFIKDVYVRPLVDENRAEAWIEVYNCELRNVPIAFDISVYGQNFPEMVFCDRRINVTTAQIAGHGDLDKQLSQLARKPISAGNTASR